MEFLFLIYFDSFRFSEYMEYRKKVNNAVIPSISLIAIASILSSIAVGCCAFLELDVTYFNTSGKISWFLVVCMHACMYVCNFISDAMYVFWGLARFHFGF